MNKVMTLAGTKRALGRKVLVGLVAFALLQPGPALADPLTTVSDELSRADGGASGVTHTINFTSLLPITADASNELRIDLSTGPFTGAACGSITVSPALTGQSCSVSTDVVTIGFTQALAAETAMTVTIGGTTNPSPASNAGYLIPLATRQLGANIDSANAAVWIWASGVATTITVASGLTVTATAGADIVFDLDAAGVATDTTKTSTISVITNATGGFSLAVRASQALTHTAYNTTTVPDNFGGTPTVASAWSAGGIGLGYSLDGGTNYYTFDTTTARTIHTGAGPTTGSNRVINYRASIDWTVPAGVYKTTLYFIAVPQY